jgi:RNA ligase (TIGR02306 family)
MEGTDVSDWLQITHYDPDAGKETGETSNAPKLRKKYPQSFRGWYNYVKRRIRNFFRIGPNTDGSSDNISLGIPTYDVDALKNYPNVFIEGEEVIVTEKIHGSNARYIFLDGIMYAGSRNLWKSPTSSCIFRKNLKENPWIEEWCRAHEGYVLWGELTPTQKGYEYGSTKPQFFPFDIRKPDGTWLDNTDTDFMDLVVPLIGHSVPVLYQGPYNLEKIKSFVDGDSLVPNAKNIREGVVIKTNPERHVHGVGRAQLKVVSNAFLMKDNK